MLRIERFRCGALALVLLCAPCLGFAQSCANPIVIAPPETSVSGSTCSGTNYLSSVANGAIPSPGPQVIYRQPDLSAVAVSEFVSLQADPNSLSLYVCSSPCSTYASCFAVADVGANGETVVNLTPPREAYLIVGSSNGSCSSYTLSISAPD